MNMWGSINKEVLTSTVAGLVDVLSPSEALTCNVNFEPSLSIIEQATRTWPESGSTWNISTPSPPTTKWDMTALGSKSSSEAWKVRVSFVVKALKPTLRLVKVTLLYNWCETLNRLKTWYLWKSIVSPSDNGSSRFTGIKLEITVHEATSYTIRHRLTLLCFKRMQVWKLWVKIQNSGSWILTG